MPATEFSKEEIVDIALDGFLKTGIQSVTMKKLAESLGVSTKTIYKLFTNKAILLKTCLMVHYARFFSELAKIASDANNEMESLLRIVDRTLELEFTINPQFYSDLNKYYSELQNDVIYSQSKLLAGLGGTIEGGKENGFFLPEIDEKVFWVAFQHLYSGITRENTYSHMGLPAQELIKNTVLVYIRGICTSYGLQKLQGYLKSRTLKIL